MTTTWETARACASLIPPVRCDVLLLAEQRQDTTTHAAVSNLSGGEEDTSKFRRQKKTRQSNTKFPSQSVTGLHDEPVTSSQHLAEVAHRAGFPAQPCGGVRRPAELVARSEHLFLMEITTSSTAVRCCLRHMLLHLAAYYGVLSVVRSRLCAIACERCPWFSLC